MKKLFALGMIFLLGACASATSLPEGELFLDEDVLFPHVEGWSDPTKHGTYVDRHSNATCENCHASDAGPAAMAFCVTCHADYPHNDDWSTQHKSVLNERGGTTSCATGCHGEDLHGGRTGRDCAECHTQYPHGDQWFDEHPQVAREQPTDIPGRQFDISPNLGTITSCTDTCHNTEISIGEMCQNCHASGVHEEGWKDREQHGNEARTLGNASCGTTCHGSAFTGGVLAPPCGECHAAYPHQVIENWDAAAGHGTWARESLPQCAKCHPAAVGFDDQYGSVEPPSSVTGIESCYSCHPAYPHTSYTFRGNTIAWNDAGHAAHILLIMRNRQLLRSESTSLNDPTLVESVRARCASGPNGCHVNGRLAEDAPATTGAACRVCH